MTLMTPMTLMTLMTFMSFRMTFSATKICDIYKISNNSNTY